MSKLLEQINVEKEEHQISDLVEIKYGFGLPERDRVKGSVPVYASSGLVGFHNESKVKKSSIIIGRKGNVGSLSYLKSESFPIDTVFYIDETVEGFNLRYVYYLLQRINLPRYGGDSAVPGLSRDTVYSITVETPKEETQKKIASILSAYDEKIENNNKIINNLEETVQAIFNEWFVNFKFPGHEKVKMVDSETGKLPEGWKIENIEKICERLPSGKVFKESDILPIGDIPVYDQSSKGIIGFHKGEPTFNISINNPILIFGDHTCRTQLVCEPFSLGPNTVPLSEKNNYSPIFSYFLIRDLVVQREYKRHWNELISYKLSIPPSELAELFSERAKIFIERIVACGKENISLRSQRDQLLAKLI